MSVNLKIPRLAGPTGLSVFYDGRPCLTAAPSQELIYAGGPPQANGALVSISYSGDRLSFVTKGAENPSYPTSVLALSSSNNGDWLAVANDKHEIALYESRSMNFVGNITTFTLPPRAVTFSANDELIASGGDDRIVRVIKRSDPLDQPYELHVGREIKHIAFDPLGQFLLVSAKDGSVSVYDIESPSRELVKCFEGCKMLDKNGSDYSNIEYPVAWHPNAAVFAVASDHGVLVYSRDGFKQIYHLRGPAAPETVDSAWQGTTVVTWSPNGRYLVAVDGRRIATVWDVTMKAIDPATKRFVRKEPGNTSEPAVVITGFIDHVKAFDPLESSVPAASPDDAPIPKAAVSSTRLIAAVWKDNALVYIDSRGEVGAVPVGKLIERAGGSINEELSDPIDWPLTVAQPTAGHQTEAEPIDHQIDLEEAFRLIDDAALLDTSVHDSGAVHRTVTEGPQDGADLNETTNVSVLKHTHGFTDVDGDESGEEGGIRRIPEKSNEDPSELLEELVSSGKVVTIDQLERHVITTGRYIKEIYGLVAAQHPFQPSSTSFGKNRRRRFLVWNSIGTIVAGRDATNSSFINIDFHDVAKHRSLHFGDTNRISVATLSEQGAVLASKYKPPTSVGVHGEATEDGLPSQIRFRAFGGSGHTDWTVTLPVYNPRKPAWKFPSATYAVPDVSKDDTPDDDNFIDQEDGKGDGPAEEIVDTSAAAESALGVAIGDGWFAVVTDRQFVRFFRSGGSQDMVFSIPGTVVTVAGRGALCAVAYHKSLPSGYRQNIAVDVYLFRCSVEGSQLPRKLVSIDLPMRPHALLQWIGFSPNGMLLIHDSLGTLYGSTAAMEWSWTPVCDTKTAALNAGESVFLTEKAQKKFQQEVSDSFWPVDVIMAPPTTSSSMETSASVNVSAPGGVVPTLVAVLCKGVSKEPTPAKSLPVTNFLPLRVPVIDASGTNDILLLEEMYLRHEMLRMHRMWMNRVGLSNANASALPLNSAIAAAVANAQGIPMDAAIALQTQLAEQRDANRQYATSLDKAILATIKIACETDMEARAFQLASRLHNDKSFVLAQKIAGATQSTAVAERVSHLLAARQAVEAAELGFEVENVSDYQVLPPPMQIQVDGDNGADTTTKNSPAPPPQPRFGLSAIPGLSARPAPPKHTAPAPQPNVDTLAGGVSVGERRSAVGGSPSDLPRNGAATNPFSKGPSSPAKRPRTQMLEGLMTASPAKEGPHLNRQSSFAADAREAKRARMEDM